MKITEVILDLFFPRKCLFCNKIMHDKEVDWCEKCTETLPYTEFGSSIEGDYFDFCITPLYYKNKAREALRRLKFRNAPIYADCLGGMLAETIREHPELWKPGTSREQPVYDIITWVPLSAKRKKERGFDQAELLAAATATHLDTNAIRILTKVINTRPQSELSDAADRRSNIDGAYDVIDTILINDKCILLIDDIITTGSTLSECAKVLLEAGANRIICACICRRD